jgi:hypothetical protein
VDDIETERPDICVHPVTGRRYVFISGVRSRFKGTTEGKRNSIIDFLIARAIRPDTYHSTVEGWVPRGHLSTAPPDRLERQPSACDCPLRQAGSSDARRA